MNLATRIGRWIRTALGFAAAGSVVASSSAQPPSRDDSSLTYRLTWFELQVDPFVYRFAYSPGEPLFIALPGEDGEKGSVLLVRPDHMPKEYDRAVERLAASIRKNGVMHVPMVQPNQAFSEEAIKERNVHLRFRFADNTGWASVFTSDAVPPEVNQLLSETKSLARELLARESNQKLDEDQAREHLKSDAAHARDVSSDIVLKIRISTSGAIAVDERAVTFAELERTLDLLKERKGTVWYYREAGAFEPPPETLAIIKQVLDAVVTRQLPIKLQEQKY